MGAELTIDISEKGRKMLALPILRRLIQCRVICVLARNRRAITTLTG